MDWISEVTHLFKLNIQTTSLAMEIVDSYLLALQTQSPRRTLGDQDIHLIGVVSMFIAAKYEEIYPPDSKTVADKVSHGAFSQKLILSKEQEFMVVLDFDF